MFYAVFHENTYNPRDLRTTLLGFQSRKDRSMFIGRFEDAIGIYVVEVKQASIKPKHLYAMKVSGEDIFYEGIPVRKSRMCS